jgi:hypothetical protein
MDILLGADPDAWSSIVDYVADDRVLQGGKRYKCILANLNQVPPNVTYWEQSGILITGNVGGVNTVGIDGNLVVDDTIYSRSINAFVGMTIQSTIYDPGVTGWQINANGDVDFTSGTAAWSSITGPGKPDDYADVSPTSLDGLPDGATYGRVLTTAISAGKIVLTSSGVSGTLPTSLSAAKCTDANADQTSAHSCNDPWSGHDLDDLANGTYGKVLTTAISAGKIVLTSSGVSGTLPTSLSAVSTT